MTIPGFTRWSPHLTDPVAVDEGAPSSQLVAQLYQPFWTGWQAGEFLTDAAARAVSHDERLELVEYIESTVESARIEVIEEQKAMIRWRAAELRADPSIGLT